MKSDDDKKLVEKKLIEIINGQLANTKGSREFFTSLVSRADLPKKNWHYEIAGEEYWTGDYNKDTRKFIGWAKSKNILNKILEEFKQSVGNDQQATISKYIKNNEPDSNNASLENLKIEVEGEISESQDNRENSLTENSNTIATENRIFSQGNLNKYFKKSLNGYEKSKQNQIEIIGIVLVLISAPSVFFSYLQLRPLIPISAFNDCEIATDFFIEAIRSSIIILGVTHEFFGKLFLEEVLDIFCFGLIKLNKKSKVFWTEIELKYRVNNIKWARIVLLFLVILGCIFLVIYHLDYAPQQYSKQFECVSTSELSCLDYISKSYLFYIPYSFIHFIIIAVPAFIVSLYGQQKDLVVIKRAKKIAIKLIKENQNKVNQIFESINSLYEDKIERYISLSLIYCAVFFFEILIGTQAAYFVATIVTVTGGVFLGFTFWIILDTLNCYEDVWNTADSNYRRKNPSYSQKKFIQNVWNKNLTKLFKIICIIIIIIITSIWLDNFLGKCS